MSAQSPAAPGGEGREQDRLLPVANIQRIMRRLLPADEKISKDDDVLKVLVHVMTGMREILPRMVKYITTWDRYKPIWDVDKDAFMRRYAKANRALTAFETDITRYEQPQPRAP